MKLLLMIAMTASVVSNSPALDASKSLPTSGVTISYSAPTHQITLHEPVIITYRVVNQTGLPINLDLGQDRKWGFLIAITKPDGVKLDFPVLIHEGLSRPGEVSLASAETFTQDLLINEWYDFPEPGKYEIEVRLSKPTAVRLKVEQNQLVGVPE